VRRLSARSRSSRNSADAAGCGPEGLPDQGRLSVDAREDQNHNPGQIKRYQENFDGGSALKEAAGPSSLRFAAE
jgi:hypothetical protein